jgi:hypothetical protein
MVLVPFQKFPGRAVFRRLRCNLQFFAMKSVVFAAVRKFITYPATDFDAIFIGDCDVAAIKQRMEIGPHRVGMNAVVELGQGAVEIPGKGQAAVFVVLEPLEFLDEI